MWRKTKMPCNSLQLIEIHLITVIYLIRAMRSFRVGWICVIREYVLSSRFTTTSYQFSSNYQ